MISYKTIFEDLISPSTEPNTLSFWHGGNLDYGPDENYIQKKGRFQFAPGLYLTTSYNVVEKYKKGSRKLYLVTIQKGVDAKEASIPFHAIDDFVKYYCIKSKRKEVLVAASKYNYKDRISAVIFINIMVNYEAIKPSDSNNLRRFLVQHGVDYSIVDNAFGWGERMVVLFNMKLITNSKVVKPKDKIEVWNLPTEWN